MAWRPLTERSYLGRGQEPIAGQPFGYAHVMERREIRAHLLARGWSPDDMRLEFRVTKIQDRLNRGHAAKWKARQDAWKAANCRPAAPSESFTREELARLADRFEGANDPVGQAILAKVGKMIEKMPAEHVLQG